MKRDPKGPAIKSQDIVCSNGMPAFLAYPANGKPAPVVIFLHERYGLVQHTRDLAELCASDGYAVLAPNIFFQHADQAGLKAGDARCDLSDQDAIAFLTAAVDTLKARPDVDASKVAVAGYCQTGRHPLVFAAEVPITAAVVWYGAASKREWDAREGQPKALTDIIAQLDCPVFGAFGERDHIIPVEQVLRLRNCLEDNRKSYDFHLYKDAPHGWLNDTMPGRYREPQARAGWAAQQRFLARVFAPDFDHTTTTWSFEGSSSPDYDYSKNVRLE
jgi:carboxymethylenebutenolidase